MQNRRVWAEIDLDALPSNLNRVRALAGEGKGIMAIVKANAYGHGAVPIACHLASQGVNALGVGDSEEAMELTAARGSRSRSSSSARSSPASSPTSSTTTSR